MIYARSESESANGSYFVIVNFVFCNFSETNILLCVCVYVNVKVVTLVVYSYFVACLIGYQDVGRNSSELPVPVILFLLFFFYMGWLKVKGLLL